MNVKILVKNLYILLCNANNNISSTCEGSQWEVANLTKIKNPNTPVFGVKEFVRLFLGRK